MSEKGILPDNHTLQTFVAIAESGSFSKAATVVRRSPSAVSMQIKRLEEQLGVQLFVRDARSVKLTSHGETLLFEARRLLSLSNEIAARFLLPEFQDRVALGVPNDVADRQLPGTLKEVNESYPGITVDVTVGTSEFLLSRADRDELDLAIINYDATSSNKPGELLRESQLVWAGRKDGVARQREPLPVSLYEEGCIWRDAAIRQLDGQSRKYRIAYSSPHSMMQKVAIDSDLAVAPIPLSYLTNEMIVLGKREGFGKLPPYDVRLLVVKELSMSGNAIAGFIRKAFGAR